MVAFLPRLGQTAARVLSFRHVGTTLRYTVSTLPTHPRRLPGKQRRYKWLETGGFARHSAARGEARDPAAKTCPLDPMAVAFSFWRCSRRCFRRCCFASCRSYFEIGTALRKLRHSAARAPVAAIRGRAHVARSNPQPKRHPSHTDTRSKCPHLPASSAPASNA